MKILVVLPSEIESVLDWEDAPLRLARAAAAGVDRNKLSLRRFRGEDLVVECTFDGKYRDLATAYSPYMKRCKPDVVVGLKAFDWRRNSLISHEYLDAVYRAQQSCSPSELHWVEVGFLADPYPEGDDNEDLCPIAPTGSVKTVPANCFELVYDPDDYGRYVDKTLEDLGLHQAQVWYKDPEAVRALKSPHLVQHRP